MHCYFISKICILSSLLFYMFVSLLILLNHCRFEAKFCSVVDICILAAQYKTEAEARETRHALHGVRWPVSNPKQLCVDFGKKEDMDLAQALTEEDQVPRKTEPLKVERSVEGWVAEQVREKERERELREREREREKERSRVKERPHHAVPAVETLERSRNTKVRLTHK